MIDANTPIKLRQTLYCSAASNADGTPKRCRVTGSIQRWKRDPARFRIPVKAGMYEYGAIEQWNGGHWHVSEADAIENRVVGRMNEDKLTT